MNAIAIFVYGFAKNDRANISSAELEVWRRIAKDLLVSEAALSAAMQEGKLIEVTCDQEKVS